MKHMIQPFGIDMYNKVLTDTKSSNTSNSTKNSTKSSTTK